MQGVLIASADIAVRQSLTAIVGRGKTVYECGNGSELLALAAAQKMDYVFVDDVFKDGNAEELVSRLHQLGYFGLEIIPILLSDEPRYLEPFRRHGVRYCIVKPFNVHKVQSVIEQIDQMAQAAGNQVPFSFEELTADAGPATGEMPASHQWEAPREIDIREISQRFRRLLASSLRRSDLIAAFAEGMQEQFDADNVVVLLPAREAPCFRVVCGHVEDEVREQFSIPFGEPLVTALLRLGEPLRIDDCERLGSQNATTALRYGERLGVRILCPVTSRGRALAIVGLSRIHRYEASPFLISILRLFLTFFSKALENADLYGRVSTAEQAYRRIFDALPTGAMAVSADGTVCHVNPVAAAHLGEASDRLEMQPIERAGSLLADAAREVLVTGDPTGSRILTIRQRDFQVSAVPLGEDASCGVLLLLDDKAADGSTKVARRDAAEFDEVMTDMSRSLGHNFKNALVPIKTCAELLPERYDQEAFRRSFFEVVQESIGKIDGWITRLMRFSEMPEASRPATVFPLHETLDKGLERALSRFPNLDVVVHRDYAHENGDSVKAGREALEQMFTEIVGNALDAMQDVPEPVLQLSTLATAEGVTARVEDNGQGVDQNVEAAAFRPFFTKKMSGLGLGLAYVRKIAGAYGGNVAISPGTERGGCVQVDLPAARQKSAVTS